MFQDAEHLKLLAMAHYVVGAVTGLFACMPLIHVAMGVMMLTGKFPGGTGTGGMPPDAMWMGWLFIGMGGLFVLAGWATAIGMFLTGRWLSARRNYTFCFVVACVECLFVPLGTVLGVFCLLVLQRPSIKALFHPDGDRGEWAA